MLDNTPSQLSKFKAKIWIEVNNQSRGLYNTNSDIRFKSTMLKSALCNYSDVYIHVKGRKTITWGGAHATARQPDERNEGVILKIVLYLLILKVRQII